MRPGPRRCVAAQVDGAQVPVDVEVGVVDPHRVVDRQERGQEPLTEHRDAVQPTDDVGPEALEGVPGRDRRGIQHQDPGHVHVHDRVLHVQERGVGRSDALHGTSVSVNSGQPLGGCSVRIGADLPEPCRRPLIHRASA